jgi:lipoic acid synthetase
MVGLGEPEEDVIETMRDLRSVGVDFLTLGQYLRPSKKHIPLEEFVHPDQFAEYERVGRELGFLYVASGPLVRSSYKAGEYFIGNLLDARSRGEEWAPAPPTTAPPGHSDVARRRLKVLG